MQDQTKYNNGSLKRSALARVGSLPAESLTKEVSPMAIGAGIMRLKIRIEICRNRMKKIRDRMTAYEAFLKANVRVKKVATFK